MMIRKFLFPGISTVLLLVLAPFATAANLYRFPDENGVPTLSRTLPPEAAQKGYDILDSNSMRLIEHVPPALTTEQLEEQEKQQQREAEARKQAEITARETEKQQQQQAAYDRKLLTTYRSEEDLIRARDNELEHRRNLISSHQSKLPKLEQRLFEIQQSAADTELSGGKITANMQNRLDAALQEIVLRQQAIKDLQSEIETITAEYDGELNRLRELLKARQQ